MSGGNRFVIGGRPVLGKTAMVEELRRVIESLPKVDFVGAQGGQQTLYVVEMGCEDLLERMNLGPAAEGCGDHPAIEP